MLSKPSPESSVGKLRSARNSIASRSRIVFVYSARFSRRAVTRPGSGFMLASARANSASRKVTRAAISASGRSTSAGGISRDLSFIRTTSHWSRPASSVSTDRYLVKSNPPSASVALWHSLQVLSKSDCVTAAKAAAVGGREVASLGAWRGGAAGPREAAACRGAAGGGACAEDLISTATTNAIEVNPRARV